MYEYRVIGAQDIRNTRDPQVAARTATRRGAQQHWQEQLQQVLDKHAAEGFRLVPVVVPVLRDAAMLIMEREVSGREPEA